MNGPFYWKARKGWYVKEVDAQQRRTNRRLAATKKEAFEIWKTEEAAKRPDSVKLETIVSKYLLWADRQATIGALNAVTVESYEWYLLRLLDRLPDQWVDELKPHHIADWIADSGWGAAGERNAISAIKRALNWAVEQGLISNNPIAKMKRPATPRRSVVVEAEIHKQLMEAVTDVKSNGRIDRQFRLVLVAVKHCGGRPQDVARARVEYVDADVETWSLPEHKKARVTGQPKIVYLSPCLQTVTRIAMHGRTDGPLFRSRAGALTTNAITCRMRRLRDRLNLPEGTVAYSYRHTYITDALQNGVVHILSYLPCSLRKLPVQPYSFLCGKAAAVRARLVIQPPWRETSVGSVSGSSVICGTILGTIRRRASTDTAFTMRICC